MKLSDLRTGMVVTTAENEEFIVFTDAVCATPYDCGLVFVNGLNRWWIRGINYNEDLSHRGHSDLDIIRVEMVTHPYAYMDLSYDRESRILLWERDPEPESQNCGGFA